MKIFIIFISFVLSLFANPLQDAIDKAKPYSTIELGNGIYQGNIVITKPLKIIGRGKKVIIDGGKKGSIILLKSLNITLQNLTIRGTGHRKEMVDSAIKGKGINNIIIKNCIILDSLYGINISLANNIKIISNTISSKDEKKPLRGDGIKFWYVKNAKIIDNNFSKVRDNHFDRCDNIILKDNRFLHSRFATHIEYSKNITIEQNFYRYNSTGILLEMAKNIKIVKNKILNSNGMAAVGALFRGGEGILFENNIVKYNREGLYIDAKPSKLKKFKRKITNNEISFNLQAIHFHAIIANNIITYNKIHDNLYDIVKDITGYKNINNKVSHNYWGQYKGFDRNHDNIGDTPYIIKRYFDKLYSYNNKIKFFYGSTVMAVVDFLCEIAPFTEPEILLQDNEPIFKDSL